MSIELSIIARKRIREEERKVINQKICDLYNLSYSMNEICEMLSVSKTTVFLAVNGRTRKSNKNNKKK